MREPMKRAWHYYRVPRTEAREVPEGMLRLAERRTEGIGSRALHQPLQYLLASAYMQGVNDTFDALEHAKTES